MSGLELAAAIAGAAGSAVEGLGAYQAGRYNAAVDRAEAQSRAAAAAAKASRAVEETRRVMGQAGAIAGASGFTLGGSAADVLGDLARQGSVNAQTIVYQGDLERRALLDKAKQDEAGGVFGLAGGVFGAATSILGGLGAGLRPAVSAAATPRPLVSTLSTPFRLNAALP